MVIKVGVIKALYPILYYIYREKIVQQDPINEAGVEIDREILTTKRHADDTVVLAETEEDLERNMNKLV